MSLLRVFGSCLMIGIGALSFGVVALTMRLLLASGRIFQLIVDLIEGKAAALNGRMNTSRSEKIENGLSTITRQKTEQSNRVTSSGVSISRSVKRRSTCF